MTFEQSLEGSEGGGEGAPVSGGREAQAVGTACAKALRQEGYLEYLRRNRSQWLEQGGLRGKVVGDGVDRDQPPKATIFSLLGSPWRVWAGSDALDMLPHELVLSNNLLKVVTERVARGSVRVLYLLQAWEVGVVNTYLTGEETEI